MMMSDRLDKVGALVDELVAELRAVNQLDEVSRHKLAEAASEMIAVLHRDEAAEPPAGDDASSLRDRIVEFEASHPNLAAVVNRLIDMLGQMGI
jgi:hypothetical protein